jgi:hypothetical protein
MKRHTTLARRSDATSKTLWRGFLVVLALTVMAELFVDLHPHFEIEKFRLQRRYGFITCAAMIVGAKALACCSSAARHLLRRSDEDDE